MENIRTNNTTTTTPLLQAPLPCQYRSNTKLKRSLDKQLTNMMGPKMGQEANATPLLR